LPRWRAPPSNNWLAHTTRNASPVRAARGDAAVVERHLAAMHDQPELEEIYRLLAARIVATAK